MAFAGRVHSFLFPAINGMHFIQWQWECNKGLMFKC